MSDFVLVKRDYLLYLISGGNLNFMWFIFLFKFILYKCFKFINKEKDKVR